MQLSRNLRRSLKICQVLREWPIELCRTILRGQWRKVELQLNIWSLLRRKNSKNFHLVSAKFFKYWSQLKPRADQEAVCRWCFNYFWCFFSAFRCFIYVNTNENEEIFKTNKRKKQKRECAAWDSYEKVFIILRHFRPQMIADNIDGIFRRRKSEKLQIFALSCRRIQFKHIFSLILFEMHSFFELWALKVD